ncbi:beta-glucosidase, partial [Phenoliferia sp. Uapishka_3]
MKLPYLAIPESQTLALRLHPGSGGRPTILFRVHERVADPNEDLPPSRIPCKAPANTEADMAQEVVEHIKLKAGNSGEQIATGKFEWSGDGSLTKACHACLFLDLPYISTTFNLLWALFWAAKKTRKQNLEHPNGRGNLVLSIIQNEPELPRTQYPALKESHEQYERHFQGNSEVFRRVNQDYEVVVPGTIPCSAVQQSYDISYLFEIFPNFLTASLIKVIESKASTFPHFAYSIFESLQPATDQIWEKWSRETATKLSSQQDLEISLHAVTSMKETLGHWDVGDQRERADVDALRNRLDKFYLSLMNTEHEISVLKQAILTHGRPTADGRTVVTYGVLFDKTADTLEALNGTLRAAKRQKKVRRSALEWGISDSAGSSPKIKMWRSPGSSEGLGGKARGLRDVRLDERGCLLSQYGELCDALLLESLAIHLGGRTSFLSDIHLSGKSNPMLLTIAVQAALLGTLAAASPLHQRTHTHSSPSDPHAGPPLPSDYVGPLATGGTWTAGFKKAKAIVDQMTLAELVNVTTGYNGPCSGTTGSVPRLGLPARCFEDGPLGVRPTDYVSQFPAGVTVAATWDRDLFYKRANAIGQEFHDKGVHLALGPVTGGPLGRSPLGGRNWEGGSPDNYVNGVLSYIGVKGLQDAGVQASAKHYIAYEQETYRTPYSATTSNVTSRDQQIDSYLDDTTMHELYLTSFAEAVRAGAASIMCSYNSVNGLHACGNNHTLNGLLKSELGFQGYVVSDWGGVWATTDPVRALFSWIAGLDTEMPGAGFDGQLGDFLGYKLANLSEAGGIELSRLKDMAIRSLLPYYQLVLPLSDLSGQDSNYPEISFDMASLADGLVSGQYVVNQHLNVQRDHYKIIRTVGEASATLLKNVVTGGKGLPIKNSTTRLGIFGQDATYQSGGLTGCGATSDCTISADNNLAGVGPNGTQSSGGGSGTALAPYVYTPLEAITARGRRTGMKVDYELNDSNDTLPFVTVTAGNVKKAAFQSEGFDRNDLQLDHNGAILVNTVAAACSDVVVVVHSGGQVDMESFAEHENITAIIFAYYPGQETGAAIDSILFGDVSPSGKLPWTIGKSIEDYPSGAGSIVRDDVKAPNAHFTEGVLIDYKWFDAKNITPRYPFGFGLSYSTFEFSNATITSNNTLSAQTADANYVQKTNEILSGGGDLYDQLYTVGVTLANTGDVYAAEVAQVYLTFPSSVTNQPPRLLRGFSKAYLDPGESTALEFPIRAKDIAVWKTDVQAWAIPSGEFTFSIGSSSRDLPLSVKFKY